MVIRDHHNHLNIDTLVLKKYLEKMTKWEDWYEMCDMIFKVKTWKHTDVDIMERQKERIIEERGGCSWKPLANPVVIDKNIEYLYEICREMAFKKFETEAYYENLSDTKNFGKQCVVCDIYTEESKIKKCPFCGKKLFLWFLRNY